jgi:hypothetical protein
LDEHWLHGRGAAAFGAGIGVVVAPGSNSRGDAEQRAELRHIAVGARIDAEPYREFDTARNAAGNGRR